MAKDKYEISLWEDYLVPATDEVPEHYEEKKIAVIGTDQMTLACRAIEPNLVENINGTNTFTFKMVYKCYNDNLDELKYQLLVQPNEGEDGANHLVDSDSLQLIWSKLFFKDGMYNNPFIDFLFNERKVKVLWKNKWYDFVIKNYQKDSNNRTVTFTCKDLFINELSKNGYNLEFDTKLENNQGTIIELAEKVLEGTSWQVDAEHSDIIQQEKEEPVYESSVTDTFLAVNETDGGNITISENSTILVFYSSITSIVDKIEEDKTTGNQYIQFLYATNYEKDINSQLVLNGICCALDNAKWEVENLNFGAKAIKIYTDTTNYFTVYYQTGVSSKYRAKRLVKSIQSILDPLTGKYVNIYIATQNDEGVCEIGDEIYGYRDTLFKDPISVNNLVVNSTEFNSLNGWYSNLSIPLILYPNFTKETDISRYVAKPFLGFTGGYIYVNSGLTELSYLIPEGFQKGEKYIFRAKVRKGNSIGPSNASSNPYYNTDVLKPSIRGYNTKNGSIVLNSLQYFEFKEPTTTTDGWIEYEAECIQSITRSSLYAKKVGLCFEPDVNSDGSKYWIEDIQFFQYVEGLEGEGEDLHPVRINPGDFNTQSVATVRYNYYNHTKSKDITSVDDLTYIYRSFLDWVDPPFEPLNNDNFSKIRSITISKSNRFNILQTLAETFECWLEPRIEHDQNGFFIYDNGVPRKFVSFKKERGIETNLVFEYGIDLKTIQKTVQSDQIVTKTIVSPNNNQFAPNGFCTIARSTENYPRTNFILNFDYYINQGLIDGAALYRDLYLAVADENTGENYTDAIGYYYWLHKYNLEYDENSEQLTAKRTERDKQKSYYDTYNEFVNQTEKEIISKHSYLASLAGQGLTWENPKVAQYVADNAEIIEIKREIATLTVLENSLVQYTEIRDSIYKEEESESGDIITSGVLVELNNYIEELEERQKEINEKIKEVEAAFYRKYSYFIQEGTWIDEKYIDENLYYLDAQSVAYTSAFPQVSYNISVLRLTSLEPFKNKIFNVGDIAFIQDTDFFGYVYINSIKTPYKEKVLISEVSSFFDEPDKDSFKIQNYKTQFEDLFQRINSATQSLKYNEGSYAKAASIVNTDGTINIETLQQSLNKATNLMYSSVNNAITQDNTGITVVDIANPNNMTKITSGGLFISNDGGTSWRDAVSAEGIAVGQLTSGNINTSSINILDGEFPSFRWDSKGISAFEINNIGVDFSKYVRFDHFGIYGITNLENFTPQTEDEIWNIAKFGLTWKGFFLKSDYTNGYVSISSDNDFQVMQTISNYSEIVHNDIDDTDEEIVSSKTIERIKIGAIEFENGLPTKYGITIKNLNEEIVFETGDDGNLKITGQIEANSGHIGKLSIVDDSLYMDRIYITPGIGIYAEYPGRELYAYTDEGIVGRSIVTDGSEEGTIEPVNIEPLFLISDEDGSALFNNITARGHIDAKTGTLGDLDVIGVLTVGDVNGESIKINGSFDTETGIHNASIYSSSYETSNFTDGWMIGYDGHAIFNNITARGAIKTAVFEYGEIQAVGGIYLFRPSSTIRTAEVDGEDLIVGLENPYLFSRNDYCKVSNYISGGGAADPNIENILSNNGLAYVYKIDIKETYIGEDTNFSGIVGTGQVDHATIASDSDIKREIRLIGAAELVQGATAIATVENLEGAALVNMGRAQDSINYYNGRFNYGIGINSSDNTVNLPARAISLFETIIDPSNSIKVLYDFKAILGTLPELGSLVDNSIYKNLVGTQGIFTNNMYIGDANNYLAFYTDKEDNDIAKLTIKAIVYAIGGQIGGWNIDDNSLYTYKKDPQGNLTDEIIKLSSIGDSLTIGDNFKVVDNGALVIGSYIFDTDGIVYRENDQETGNLIKEFKFSDEGIVLESGENKNIFLANENLVEIGNQELGDYLDYNVVSNYYEQIEDPTGSNPKENWWYEEVEGQYVLTEDTEAQIGKTYYQLYKAKGFLNLKVNSITLGQEDLEGRLNIINTSIENISGTLEEVKNNFKVKRELSFVDSNDNKKWYTCLSSDNNLNDVWIGEE